MFCMDLLLLKMQNCRTKAQASWPPTVQDSWPSTMLSLRNRVGMEAAGDIARHYEDKDLSPSSSMVP